MKQLWLRGIFWMAVLFSITAMLIMMANGHYSWYHYIFIMLLLPGLMVIISCLILTRPGSITGQDLIELLKYMVKLIYDSSLKFLNRKQQ